LEWIIFAGVAFLVTMQMVPLKRWKILWPLGLVAMLLIYFIDNTLIGLKAFAYSSVSPVISGIPIPYLISGFPGGILLGYFCPRELWPRSLYILLAAFVFLVLELIMFWLGHFYYINWSPVKSFFLNVGGFTVFIWVTDWLGVLRNKEAFFE